MGNRSTREHGSVRDLTSASTSSALPPPLPIPGGSQRSSIVSRSSNAPPIPPPSHSLPHGGSREDDGDDDAVVVPTTGASSSSGSSSGSGSAGTAGHAKDFVPHDVSTSSDGYSFWDQQRPTGAPAAPQIRIPAQHQKANQLQATMQATMRATLGGGGDLAETVKLPQGEDLNEWIAVNTVQFYNAVSMIYGTCAEFCTELSCPSMFAGKNEYLWKDSKEYKKPTRVPASQYIDLSLASIDEQISDPAIFPIEEGAKFPRSFMTVVKGMYKRMFRVYAHIYYSHIDKIRSIGANAHLNTCFKHFIFFVLEFHLIDTAELQPLEKLIAKLRDRSDATS